MAKKPSTFLNMVGTLWAITFFSSMALGFVYEITKHPIAQAAIEKKINAIREVIPDFNNNPLEEVYVVEMENDAFQIYPAKMDNEPIAFAVEAISTKGFSGDIKILVGLLPDGTIHRIAVLESQETPGLGDKIRAEKSDFSKQFFDKNPDRFVLKVKKDGGSVDAITAATISSRAFCDAVQKAYRAFQAR